MTFTPTAEQQAIIDFGKQEKQNLLVEARAGAAKTSTLEMLAQALPSTDILYLAFNKSVQTEAQERLPHNCEALTLHSLGYRAWQDVCPNRCQLDSKKASGNLREVLETLSSEDRQTYEDDNLWESCKEGLQFAKQCGWVPEKLGSKSARPLVDDFEFFNERLEFNPTALEKHIITEAHIIGIKQALQGKIDFDDMIFMPAIWPTHFPQHALVMVDEAQDLSSIQHRMLHKLCKNSRLIAVGDPCQAIYGFRGAHQDSMNLLAKQFGMHRLYLTTSFRCPRSVVDHAQARAPDMRYPDWAGQGSLVTLGDWNEATINDGAAIICRNNAPLIRMAFSLLADGRYPELGNGDILRMVTTALKKLGKPEVRQAQALVNVDSWQKKEEARSRYPQRIRDRAECMRIFIRRADTLGEAMKLVESMRQQKGRIHLTTGHKAKGAEWDNVFFLDSDLIDTKEDQEFNLWYVIVTRAKKQLSYVFSGNYEAKEADDGQGS